MTFRADPWKSLVIAVTLCCGSAMAGDLRIDHVTMVSPERSSPMRNVTVYIQGDRITSIYRSKPASQRSAEKNVQAIDGRGLYLSPGLIDSHVHTGGAPGMGAAQELANPDIARAAPSQVPRSYLYFGFTTLIDLAAPQQTRANPKPPLVAKPRRVDEHTQ